MQHSRQAALLSGPALGFLRAHLHECTEELFCVYSSSPVSCSSPLLIGLRTANQPCPLTGVHLLAGSLCVSFAVRTLRPQLSVYRLRRFVRTLGCSSKEIQAWSYICPIVYSLGPNFFDTLFWVLILEFVLLYLFQLMFKQLSMKFWLHSSIS